MTSAPPITARRRGGLLLVVVEVIPLLAALAAAAAGALLWPRRLDGVSEFLQREPDAPLVGIDADHEQRETVTKADRLVGPGDRSARHLRDVQEAVHAGFELDERAEVREPDDLAGDARAHRVALGDRRPRVVLDLLEPERDPLILLVDVEDLRLDLLLLLENFRRVADAAGPRHVGDVQEAVHAGLELDERAEVGQVAHLPRDPRPRAVALLDRRPRVGLDLFHAERDALRGAVDVEHDHVHLVADVHQLGGMTHAARPRHFRDVDEPLDTRLELDEGAVVGEAHHPAAGLRARRERLLHALPRVRRLLLVAERDAARLAVEVQHDHLDLVADLEDLRGMGHAPPAHVGDVQEAIDAAQVDEGAVVGDVLHGAGQHHALGEHLERVLLLLLALLFEHGPTGEDDVAAAPIQLDHLRADRLPDHRGEILDGPEVHLRAGEEGLHAHVHRQAPLDDLDDAALDGQALLVRLRDRVPYLDLVGLVLREDDEPLGVFFGLEVHLDLVADPGELAVTVKLVDRDRALALVADVHEDLRGGHLDDAATDDLALLELAAGAFVEPVLHPFLGLSLLSRLAEGALWFVRLHPAWSSSH